MPGEDGELLECLSTSDQRHLLNVHALTGDDSVWRCYGAVRFLRTLDPHLLSAVSRLTHQHSQSAPDINTADLTASATRNSRWALKLQQDAEATSDVIIIIIIDIWLKWPKQLKLLQGSAMRHQDTRFATISACFSVYFATVQNLTATFRVISPNLLLSVTTSAAVV